MRNTLLSAIAFLIAVSGLMAQQKVTIPSKDSLLITADMYVQDDSNPFIVLCHQENYSRGEYQEIGKKINALGYNCIAIDLRSGGDVNGVKNETAALAKQQRKGQSYLDAEQDILDFVYFMSEQPVVLWGSSYSASLALKIAESNDKVGTVIAFSPAEHFKGMNLAEKIRTLDKPVFITSAKTEATDVLTLTKNIRSTNKTQYIPKGLGGHGSKVLWSNSPDYLDYWSAIVLFLKDL